MEKAKKIFKIVGLPLLSILFVMALFLDVWFIYIKYHAPEKVSSITYEVGYQTTTAGEKRPFAEINYKSNEENNGYELFEIKYNYMLDESQDRFYSQGLQYISYDTKIYWSFKKDSQREDEDKSKMKIEKDFLSERRYHFHNWFGKLQPADGVTLYNYASSDNYETTTISTNPINNQTLFKIQIGEDLYLMKFKGDKKITSDYNFITRQHGDYQNNFFVVHFHYNDFYAYEDFNFFSRLLFQAVQGMQRGTSQDILFEFGDMFDFYKYDPADKSYTESTTFGKSNSENELTWFGKLFKKVMDTNKVKEDLKSYYVLSVNVSADGAKTVSDSMFNAVAGKQNFNSTGTYTDDYFFGKNVKTVTLDNLSFVDTISENTYKLSLSDKFIKENIENKDYIILYVKIDIDKINSMGLNFAGFTEKAFSDFEIYKIVKIESGVESEVSL